VENVANALAIVYAHKHGMYQSKDAMEFARRRLIHNFRSYASIYIMTTLSMELREAANDPSGLLQSNAPVSIGFAVALHLPDASWETAMRAFLKQLLPPIDLWRDHRVRLSELLNK
jgi:hypothetical protein